MELAIAYETNEKETKIIKQEMELKQRNTFLGASLGIIILLILLLWISYRNSKVIKRKNKITVNQVNQLLAYKNELLAIKEQYGRQLHELYRQPPHGTLHTPNETISLLQPRSHRPRFRIGKRTCLTPPLQE